MTERLSVWMFWTPTQWKPMDIDLRDLIHVTRKREVSADFVSLVIRQGEYFIASLESQEVSSWVYGEKTLWVTGGMTAGKPPTEAMVIWDVFFYVAVVICDDLLEQMGIYFSPDDVPFPSTLERLGDDDV